MAEPVNIGDIVSVPFGPLRLRHVGFVYDVAPGTGRIMVAHNSKDQGGVRIDTLESFSGQKKCRFTPSGTRRNPQDIVQYVEANLTRSYNAVSYNCEHFLSEALGFKKRSPQKQKLLMIAGLIGAGYLALRGSRSA